MKLIEGSIHRPVTVFMITLGVVLFGLVAGGRLAVDLLPDISYPSLTIRTDLPDAAPGDVEQFVTRPIEEAAGVVPGLTRLHSVSRPGQSEVTLEFVTGTRMDLASLSVREKLDLVTLPREAKRPAILRFDPSLDPILRFRLSGGDNLQRLRRIADRTVKTELEGAAGVAAVKVVGGEEEEIRVDVDAARLSAVGLSLTDVTRRLADENINLAGGSLTEAHAEYLIRATNLFLTPEEIGDVVLAVRRSGAPAVVAGRTASNPGDVVGVVRVSDVATVQRGAKDREVVARLDGHEAVEVSVYKEGDANTVSVARAVKRRVDRLQLPPEMKLVAVADQSRFIENAIQDVIGSAWQGGLLAVLVLFAFLRQIGTTMIVALGIPVSVFATFVIMYRLGVSLNLMSLGGLALAIGMMVDGSIVVLESIFRKREEGLGIRESASKGGSAVAMAVTASTLTSIAVFFPLVFVEGFAGQLFRDQALTITLSQLASLAVSLTLVPMLAALGGRFAGNAGALPEGGRGGRWNAVARWGLFGVVALPRLLTRGVQWAGRALRPWVNRLLVPFDAGYAWLERTYPVLLRRALTRPGPILAVSTIGFLVTLAVGAMLPRNLFPPVTQGEFFFNVRLAEGTALHVTDQTIEQVAAAIRKDSRVKHIYTSSGQVDLSAFAGSAREANRGQIAVALKRTDARTEEAVAGDLRAALDQVPGLSYEFGRPSLFTFRNPVEVEVYAYNLDTLRTLSDAVAARIAQLDGIEDVESSMRVGDPEVQIAFNRDRLAAMNLDPAGASRLVRNAVQGEAATQFSDLDRKLDIRVRASEQERSAVSELANLEVGRNRGQSVPLAAVADVQVSRGPSEIRRISQQRAALVSGNLEGRDLGSAAEEIEAALAGLDVPPGAKVTLAGQNRELSQSFGSLRFALLLAVFLVYLVMASQFESLLHPFVIMFTLPMAVSGVILTLLLTGQSVNVMVLIGLVVQAGIVVNNGIVLLDYVKQLRARGVAKLEALVEAGTVRLRPILMTTMTTALGLLPMAIGIGEGAEVRAPLALTLMGGLISSTVLTLIVLPAVYVTMDRRP
ncbi:MAG TPA: efflux RND transporter permease subunit [Candidatus Eisenbacteria bacterium]|nr:efflux RND transporter permease subunit [Candidatus Eisenbacteria bacterium]